MSNPGSLKDASGAEDDLSPEVEGDMSEDPSSAQQTMSLTSDEVNYLVFR